MNPILCASLLGSNWQPNYTKCLVPDVVSNTKNRAEKELKFIEKTDDEFKSYMQPWPYIKRDEKDIANYRPN